MKILRLWILSTASALLFPAVAAAQVTGMTVTPIKPTVGFPATITVTGTNPCGAVEINYDALAAGEPPTKITHAITALPYSVKQTWTSIGPRHLTAKGQGNCTGQASIDITVAPFGRPAQAQTPTITGVIGMSTPGGIIAITGHHFGTVSAIVRTHLTSWDGKPKLLDLKVASWKDGLIEAHWPSFFGLRDQDATIEVAPFGRPVSQPHAIRFTPELVAEILPAAEVKVVSCGTDSNFDGCNGFGDPDDSVTTILVFPIGSPWGCEHAGPWTLATLCGNHENNWGAIGDDSDEDVFEITLGNDWLLDHFEFATRNDSGGTLSGPSGFPHGGTSWTPRIKWTVTPNDDVYYDIAVWVVGPKGVPHK